MCYKMGIEYWRIQDPVGQWGATAAASQSSVQQQCKSLPTVASGPCFYGTHLGLSVQHRIRKCFSSHAGQGCEKVAQSIESEAVKPLVTGHSTHGDSGWGGMQVGESAGGGKCSPSPPDTSPAMSLWAKPAPRGRHSMIVCFGMLTSDASLTGSLPK